MTVLFYSLYRGNAGWETMEVTERDGDTLTGIVGGIAVTATKEEWFGVYADRDEALSGKERIVRRLEVVSASINSE